MAPLRKIIEQILSGRSDQNVRFAHLRRVLARLGLDERVRGDRFVYAREWVETARELGRPVREPRGRLVYA